MNSDLQNPIEFLKGVGPQKGALLNKEIAVFTFSDLLHHYPFRHEDRTKFYTISEINQFNTFIQLKGSIVSKKVIGEGRKKRLTCMLQDNTGKIELVWFKGVDWVAKKIAIGKIYVVFGRPTLFGSTYNIAHPEIEPVNTKTAEGPALMPVYSLTEKLKNKFLDSKAITKLNLALLKNCYQYINDPLPVSVIKNYGLISKREALKYLHAPRSLVEIEKAKYRIKFEEFFYIQLKLIRSKKIRLVKNSGVALTNTSLLTTFYNEHLPFDLTGAQKRVTKEIYKDFKSGFQMNRLLQGDVGSGKTIVAFISILIAVSSGYQTALMAPTEILATQHFHGLDAFAQRIGIKIALLTGSTKKSERKKLAQELESGSLNLLVGTHALIEDTVVFKALGLAIVDEQHKFGVAQRAKLWKKNKNFYPHILVMTATPIPRTLAMSLYGDLEISTIDELPKGRKPIITMHKYDSHRLRVNGLIKQQVEEGRQIYIVYPLIEGSEKLDLKDLHDGYESMRRAFPEYHISIVHGKMKPADKEFEMQRFVKGETQIMVATTVIEVGVNVPNASFMVIENAERFGLAQLHQLRGRVGRGADQSYCVLMSSFKLSKDGKIRLETMVRSTDGFEIADVDLKLRGPGDVSGTQQSGLAGLKMADITQDGAILEQARAAAKELLEKDPHLADPEHNKLLNYLLQQKTGQLKWEQIS